MGRKARYLLVVIYNDWKRRNNELMLKVSQIVWLVRHNEVMLNMTMRNYHHWQGLQTMLER